MNPSCLSNRRHRRREILAVPALCLRHGGMCARGTESFSSDSLQIVGDKFMKLVADDFNLSFGLLFQFRRLHDGLIGSRQRTSDRFLTFFPDRFFEIGP